MLQPRHRCSGCERAKVWCTWDVIELMQRDWKCVLRDIYPVHNWGDNFDLFDKGGKALVNYIFEDKSFCHFR